MTLPESKSWVNRRLTPGFSTYIADGEFIIWLQFHCQLYSTLEQEPREGDVRQFWMSSETIYYTMIKRKAIENYCYMLLVTSASPQVSDVRPYMRQRALFVTSRAACRWNRMLLARGNVDSPLAATVVVKGHNARYSSGCEPPSVDKGTGGRLNSVQAACRRIWKRLTSMPPSIDSTDFLLCPGSLPDHTVNIDRIGCDDTSQKFNWVSKET